MLAFITSCEHPADPVYVSAAIPAGLGIISVLVNVTGDPKATSNRYELRANDSVKGYAILGKTIEWYAAEGTYKVEMKPDFARSTNWCSAIGSTDVGVVVTAGAIKRLTFAISCPPLSGSATLRIVGSSSGSNAPDMIRYQLVRTNGSREIYYVNLHSGDTLQARVAPGVYDVSAIRPAGCFEPGAVGIFGVFFPSFPRSVTVIVRRDQTVDVKHTLFCK